MAERLTPQIEFPLSSFLLDAAARQVRPATLRYYRQQLTWFLEFGVEAGVQTPERITAPASRAYLAGLQSRGLAQASGEPSGCIPNTGSAYEARRDRIEGAVARLIAPSHAPGKSDRRPMRRRWTIDEYPQQAFPCGIGDGGELMRRGSFCVGHG